MPGALTSMPFRAIFSASLFGATANAVGRSISSSSIRPLEAHGEVLHAVLFTDADGIRKFVVIAFKYQFSNHGRERHDFTCRYPRYVGGESS